MNAPAPVDLSPGATIAAIGALIAVLLLASGHTETLSVPLWAKILTGVALTMGTAFGGWRIVKTIGHRIFNELFVSRKRSCSVDLCVVVCLLQCLLCKCDTFHPRRTLNGLYRFVEGKRTDRGVIKQALGIGFRIASQTENLWQTSPDQDERQAKLVDPVN